MRKRLLDLILVLVSAPLWLPVLAVLALLVRVLSGAPVFFRQERVGRGGRPFRIWKLRTMSCAADPAARTITRLGAWLRPRGLDELPQILNVLGGDMSLVGPRPLTIADARRLAAAHPPFAARLALRPGVTGLAQVCLARGPALTVRLDLDYARRRSVGLDLAILLRTAWMNVVGKKRGARPLPEGQTP